MNYRPDDTIAAVATPPGKGAVAIIRISGASEYPELRLSPGGHMYAYSVTRAASLSTAGYSCIFQGRDRLRARMSSRSTVTAAL